MEHAARRFARWVLVIHVLALVVIGVLVVLAAREVYYRSHEQALDQARRRQELLATQTARGIHSFYSSIVANLDLQRRVEEEHLATYATLPAPGSLPEETREIIARLMWSQLRGRASHLIGLDRRSMTVMRQYSDDPTITADQIIGVAGPWLKTVSATQVSDAFSINDSRVNLVAAPLPGPRDRVAVAVVPLATVGRLFLADVNNMRLMSAWLVDGDGDLMMSFDPRLIGLNVEQLNPQIREIKRKYIQSGQPGTELIDRPVQMGPVKLDSGLVTIHPIAVPGNRWLLGIASSLKEVDAVVQRMFRRAFWWAVFVIVSLTALLTSTSIFMIRARLRLERVRRELLTRELDQAREIQLAWLPDGRHRTAITLDIAAVNQPASHVSGDFYNWFELPDARRVVLIGDVTGHGMAAAFLMATTQLLVRMTILNSGDAGRCLAEVNRQLCALGFSGQFVTMLLMVIETDGRTVQVASAGHPAPLISDGGGTFAPMPIEPQLVLGVESDITYETQTFSLPAGSGILLYTDGVPDALSTGGDRFGVARLTASLTPAADDAQSLIDAIVRAVEQFKNGRALADDLTLVALQLERAPVQSEPLTAAAGL